MGSKASRVAKGAAAATASSPVRVDRAEPRPIIENPITESVPTRMPVSIPREVLERNASLLDNLREMNEIHQSGLKGLGVTEEEMTQSVLDGMDENLLGLDENIRDVYEAAGDREEYRDEMFPYSAVQGLLTGEEIFQLFSQKREGAEDADLAHKFQMPLHKLRSLLRACEIPTVVPDPTDATKLDAFWAGKQ